MVYSVKELKVIAKELRKLQVDEETQKNEKRVKKELNKSIDYFNESMLKNKKGVVNEMLIEMLDEDYKFDEEQGLDYCDNISIIYHIDNELFEKLRELAIYIKYKVKSF